MFLSVFRIVFVIAISLFFSKTLLAKKLFSSPLEILVPGIGSDPNKVVQIAVDRFLGNGSPASGVFGLISDGQLELNEALKRSLVAEGLDTRFTLKKTKSTSSGFRLSGSQESAEYEYQVAGVKVCSQQIKVHHLAGFQNPIVFAKPLTVDLDFVDPKEPWPDWTIVFQNIKEEVAIRGGSSPEVRARSVCYLENQGFLEKVWESVIKYQGESYTVLANESEIMSFQPRFFDVSGTAKIYSSNPKDGTLIDVALPSLETGGYLTGEHFATRIYKANSENGTFDYSSSPTSIEFGETSVYANVVRHASWFETIGYTWAEGLKIDLAAGQGNPDNAKYEPALGNNRPRITIGSGGTALQNLMTDRDVVSHEFGHHVIFGSIQSVEGESLVLHEGLADYFTFADTGNSCLGESICKADTVGCQVRNQCLRTADNDFVYGIDTPEIALNTAHIVSQFVSGMLWDLRGTTIDAVELDRTVLRGIELLQSSSGFHDLILGLAFADAELYDGKNCDLIYTAALSRGLGSEIQDSFTCDSLPSRGTGFRETSSGVTSQKSSSKNNNLISCGSLGTSQSQESSPLTKLILLSLLLMPLVIFGFNSACKTR